jgi:hypothetical protein
MFTRSEKIKKNHTLADAVLAAECILSGRRVRSLNTSQISNRDRNEPITLAELNLIADALVSDTLLYA